jgi:beta-lactamase regulating signal transducer with metallopeptidase domain
MTTNDAVRGLLSWLATYGLHSTLFLGGAWALCALRPLASRTRERVWKLALVGGLASATLQLASGARPILGSIAWQSVESAREAAPAVPFSPGSAPGAEIGSSPSAPELTPGREAPPRANPADASIARDVPRRERREPDGLLPPRMRRASDSEREAPSGPAPAATVDIGERGALTRLAELSRSDSWPGLVLGGWIASGLLGLAGLFFSWTCLRRRMLGRRPLHDGPLVELLEHLRARAGLSRRVRLSLSPRIAAPFSTGFFHPEVCLPTAVQTTLSRAQQEALLAHELAHIVRRDPAWFGLGFVIEKLFFFQPLNRLARRRLSELAEDACDDWAVRWTGARLALASCLTEVAGWIVGERARLVTPPGLAGNRSRLGQRVARLLDDRRSPACEAPARWWPPRAAGALAVATLAVPGVSAAEARPGDSDARSAFEQSPPEKSPSGTPPAAAATTPAAEVTNPSAEHALTGEPDVLEVELELLEAELRALHAELEARALTTRFAEALRRIDARMLELRAQQARARALLARLAPNTPANAPAPLAEALPPTTDSGEPR